MGWSEGVGVGFQAVSGRRLRMQNGLVGEPALAGLASAKRQAIAEARPVL